VAWRQRAGVLLRLVPRADHELVPGAVGRALAARLVVGDEKVRLPDDFQLFRPALLAALLRLHDEAVLLVEIDAAVAGGAVRLLELDGPLERVVVEVAVLFGWVGPAYAEQVAQFAGEQLKVGTLRPAGGGPARDEGVDAIVGLQDCHAAKPVPPVGRKRVSILRRPARKRRIAAFA
jgi:hypothetical protein